MYVVFNAYRNNYKNEYFRKVTDLQASYHFETLNTLK